MKASSDTMHDRYKDYDFADARTVAETPHLAKLQAEAGGKSRITMRVDNDVLAAFKARAELVGGNYQTLMNEALKQFSQGLKLSDVVREAIHESLEPYLATRARAGSKKPKTA
ncbi:MAG: BrnA antitoxin family protein [Geobacteraceae bacterium]|nr:BrnA antitoxin family protein [Geobacteraceae bacterium]